MVNNIYELKNKILRHVESETQNMERIDVKEIGELVDMIKDLAEAEKSCWEASYYKSVTEAMDSRQDSLGYNGRMSDRSGYARQGQMGYNTTMGHDDIIGKLAEEYRNLSPEERMMMKSKVLTTLGSM